MMHALDKLEHFLPPCPAVAACVVASYLWSKPRFRYLLSSLLGKHLGLSRRRASRAGLVPV